VQERLKSQDRFSEQEEEKKLATNLKGGRQQIIKLRVTNAHN
jgi:hypothetical protein